MLKKTRLLTRPTLARQDAPFPGIVLSHRSELDVRDNVRLAPLLAAALLKGLFEHPRPGVLRPLPGRFDSVYPSFPQGPSYMTG